MMDPSVRPPRRTANEMWLQDVQSGGDLIVAQSAGTPGMVGGIDRQQGKLLFTQVVRTPHSHPFVIAGDMWYLMDDQMLYAFSTGRH